VIPQLATSPRKFGPDNYPVADVLIDDEDTPERKLSSQKPKLVILGTGWAVYIFNFPQDLIRRLLQS
jgi:hypothetical protein